MQAEANGKAVKPFSREAILHDLQRLNRESSQAVTGLKKGDRGRRPGAAHDPRPDPREGEGPGNLSVSAPPPDVLGEFLRRFITTPAARPG